MKKKAIKIAASTAVAASAFVAAAPANKADAAVNLDQIVQDAQNAGTVLKWAISVEGSADYVTRPYDAYNAAKKAIANAEKALKGASTSDKLKYEARLTDPKIQVKRAQAYIDAITSSEKIKELTANLTAAVKSNDINKVEAAYHKATAEYRKQAALLDRVYGESTRKGIRDAVKPALEKLIADYKYDVTVNMALGKVAEATKAKDWTKANSYMAEAEKYLPQVSSTFKAQLTKNKEDALNAIPLSLVTVTIANDTTLFVTLNKEVTGVATSEFALDNGLVVTSAVLNADKKTVTLTTTKQAADKTYTLTYKGTTATFKTAVSTPGNINVNKDDIHAEAGQHVALVSTFKEKSTNLPSRNQDFKVTVPKGVKVVSVNGVPASGVLATGDAANATSDVLKTDNNGQLILVLTTLDSTTAITGDTAVFEKLDKNGSTVEKEKSGELNFYAVPTVLDLTDTTGTVEYVSSDASYVVVTGGKKLTLKKSDLYQDKNAVVTFDAFKAKLSEGDVIHGTYKKDSSSVFNLVFDKAPQKDFTLNQKVITGTPAYRHVGNTVLLSGKGEPGKTVAIYVGPNDGSAIPATTAKSAETVVKSDGTWEVSVGYDTNASNPVIYSAYLHADNSTLPVYDAATKAKSKEIQVVAGDFAFNSLAATGATNDTSLIGETVDFTVATIATVQDNAIVDSKASITVKDFDGTTVKYVNGENGTTFSFTGGVLTVKFGSYSQLLNAGTVNGLSGTLQVSDMTGVTNDYGLKVNINANGIKTISGY
jgi:hypothetical protein